MAQVTMPNKHSKNLSEERKQTYIIIYTLHSSHINNASLCFRQWH